MEEYEVKFLGLNTVDLQDKIVELGGEKEFDRLYQRAVFDYPDLQLDTAGAWVRVRDEGDQVTMSYKQRLGMNPDDPTANDTGMVEHEVVVSDFNTACSILRAIGLTEKFYMENRRVRYRLHGVEIDIDTWPLLEPYVEIEGKSWADVERTIDVLQLDPSEQKRYSTTQIYAQAGIDDKEYQILTFDQQLKKTAD